MTNEKKQQIIELLKDKEVADSIGVMSEGLVKLFESIPTDEPEEKKPYDPGFWFPKADERYYEAYVGKDMIYGLGVGAENGVAYPDNCWKTSERAIEAGKKIKFLMPVERIRDVVERENHEFKGLWIIVFDNFGDEFDVAKIGEGYGEPLVGSSFDSAENAQKACDILNKMKADGQLDWLFE